MLTIHVVLAIFLIGPLVAAANQAPRALRAGDAGGLRVLSRTVSIYGWASIAVGVVGFGLVQERYGNELTDGWLIASILLFLVATLLVVLVVAPLLRAAAADETGRAKHLAGRIGALAGMASLCYAVIAVLMVWQPGS